VHDGKVYFGSREAKFVALDAFTGQPVWQQPYDARGSWILSSAGVSKGTVYFGTSDGYSLVGLNAKTGKEQFEFDAETYVYSSPAIAGGVAYFGNYSGKLYALDLKSDGKRWAEFELDARKTTTARIFNEKGRIDWQNVILKDKESSPENERWGLQQIHSYGSIASSPVIDNGVIYFGSTDSTFYAISLAKNKAPQVSLTAPDNQANFAAGTPITLSAEARDLKDQIRKVEFFARNAADRWVKIGESTHSPYQINWTGALEGQYFIKAQAMDQNGGFTATNPIEVNVSAQSATPQAAARIENTEIIKQKKEEPELISFPNPFNARVKISFILPQDGSTLLTLQGRLGTAAVLVNQHLKAGTYTVEYDGSQLAPDLYIAQLTSRNTVVVKKMLKP
jgi:hypothetical protein